MVDPTSGFLFVFLGVPVLVGLGLAFSVLAFWDPRKGRIRGAVCLGSSTTLALPTLRDLRAKTVGLWGHSDDACGDADTQIQCQPRLIGHDSEIICAEGWSYSGGRDGPRRPGIPGCCNIWAVLTGGNSYPGALLPRGISPATRASVRQLAIADDQRRISGPGVAIQPAAVTLVSRTLPKATRDRSASARPDPGRTSSLHVRYGVAGAIARR